MKILALVTDSFGGHGGIAKFNRDLLSALCGQSDVEQVVALPRLLPNAPGELPAKLNFDTRGVGGKIRYLLAVVKSAIANRQAKFIVCGHINLLPAAFLARMFCPAPVVLVIHGIDAWLPTRSGLVNWLAGKVSAVVAVSEFTQKNFLTWAEPKRAKAFILPNCVDLARFSPGAKNPALLQRYGLEGKTVLLTVARLSAAERYKGVDEVLEVFPELAREIPNLAYLIVGDGDDRARLEAKVVELRLRERVKFAGKVADAELPEHFRLADAFVMPGYGEGFGIVYLEAMASGVPAVGSTADASQEALRHGELGVLVNPHDPEDVRRGILEALRRPQGVRPPGLDYFSSEQFARRCREWVETMK